MAALNEYLRRYGWDISIFLRSYLVAAIGVLPILLLTFSILSPIVYMYIGGAGLLWIIFFAVFTSIFPSYIYKFVVLLTAFGMTIYHFAGALSGGPSDTFPGPSNLTGLIFAQLMFLFAIAYVFFERKGIKAQFIRLLDPSPQDAGLER